MERLSMKTNNITSGAPQPAKTEEVRRAVFQAVFRNLNRVSASEAMTGDVLSALTPYLRTDREPCQDSVRPRDEKWDMDKLTEFYHNGGGQWVVDFLLDHVLSEFNKALGGKGWDAYESDGGIDEAISYEINTLLEKNQAINEWDHRPLGPLLVALCSLTDKESKKGKWRVTIDYDNYQDGGRVLDGDGKVLGECYEDRGYSAEGEGVNGQLIGAIIAAIDAAMSANEGRARG